MAAFTAAEIRSVWSPVLILIIWKFTALA